MIALWQKGTKLAKIIAAHTFAQQVSLASLGTFNYHVFFLSHILCSPILSFSFSLVGTHFEKGYKTSIHSLVLWFVLLLSNTTTISLLLKKKQKHSNFVPSTSHARPPTWGQARQGERSLLAVEMAIQNGFPYSAKQTQTNWTQSSHISACFERKWSSNFEAYGNFPSKTLGLLTQFEVNQEYNYAPSRTHPCCSSAGFRLLVLASSVRTLEHFSILRAWKCN